MTLRQTLWSVLAIGLLFAPRPVWAHDGGPRVEISADRLSPGLTLEVRGVNIAPEESIAVSLVGVAGEFPLGAATGDEHGDFTQAFALPVDLPQGVYKVLVRGFSQLVVSPPITIAGPAVIADDEEESGHREEEEPLLAPLPTVVRVGATPLPAAPPTPAASSAAGAAVLLALITVWALLAAAIGWRRRRHSASH